MHEQVQSALGSAAAYLRAAQLLSGQWTDFWLSVGTSDAWVTAWTALAIADTAPQPAMDAARWLVAQQAPGGGWRYNSTVAADADSTAFAVLLFARLGLAIPSEALRFLWNHYAPGRGFATYSLKDPAHAWTHPCADVSASSLLALYAAGELEQPRLKQLFLELLHPKQHSSGDWEGYWWAEPAYATALALEVWSLAGKPPLRFPVSFPEPRDDFAAACRLLCAVHAQDATEARRLVARMLSDQQPDGAWPGDACLRVPPSHPQRGRAQTVQLSHDHRRIFTTALVCRALRAALAFCIDADLVSLPARSPRRSRQGIAADRLIHSVAAELGCPEAASVFRCLTESSLDERTCWPAPQLSSLAGGFPFEFSATVASCALPALRYTVEPGEVQAPPSRRARSAVATAEMLAHRLNYRGAWQRFLPAINALLASLDSVTEWQRFLVWIGIDHQAAEAPTLKLYFGLRSGADLPALLRAADLPLAPKSAAVLQLLSEHGFPQEVGFGLAPFGRCGIKLYWELSGWRRPLIERVLELAAFPSDAGSLCPEIPGLLRESLAAKSRAGIAVRLDASSGKLASVTTAAELLYCMLPPAEIADRLQRWIASVGLNAAPYARLFAALAPFGSPRHTLFTRTLAPSGERSAAIYLRPPIELFREEES